MEGETRSYNGMGNNLANPDWGSTNSSLSRESKAAYADGISAMGGVDRPNPRLISNQLCFSSSEILSPVGLSNFVWAWGQFLDHELDITPAGDNEDESIPVPLNDVDKEIRRALVRARGASIPFQRSTFVRGTGTSEENPRQQINRASSYIDASNVYGSALHRAQNLRSFENGKLLSQEIGGEEFPPFNTFGLNNDDGNIPNKSRAFVAGDIRINEHSVLTAMHTLFLREHNRICDEITGANSGISDEEAFQRARCRVIGHMQAITFNEFLPVLVGNRVPDYDGYDAHVNTTISNVFSTACYRLGHSMLPERIPLIDEDGSIDRVELRDLFFRPELFENGFDDILVFGRTGYVLKIDHIFRGIIQSNMLRIDPQITESVRSFLFHRTEREVEEDFLKFLDLASLNIQRGRDHGLPDYNKCRRDFGLRAVVHFADITNDVEVQTKLRNLYGSVDNIDLWVGALCEDSLSGAAVGELIATVLIDQFVRLRDGDRFWYENDPNLERDEVRGISQTRLSDIIARNTGLNDNTGGNAVTGRALKSHISLENNSRSDAGQERPLDIRIYNSRLRFSDFQSPGNLNERPGGSERLFVSSHTHNEKITVSDGSNFIHGLFNLEFDKYILYQCQQEMRDIEPFEQNLFAAEGTVAVFDEGNDRRLIAAGRDRINPQRPQGWIFNSSAGARPTTDVHDQADVFQDATFAVDNRLQFSNFNTPGIPNADSAGNPIEPRDEDLECARIGNRYLTINNSSGQLKLVGIFTLNLERKYEVYTIVDNLDLDFPDIPARQEFLDGKLHFRAQGTAVLFKENDKFRIKVAGHDKDFTGQGWIFDATEKA